MTDLLEILERANAQFPAMSVSVVKESAPETSRIARAILDTERVHVAAEIGEGFNAWDDQVATFSFERIDGHHVRGYIEIMVRWPVIDGSPVSKGMATDGPQFTYPQRAPWTWWCEQAAEVVNAALFKAGEPFRIKTFTVTEKRQEPSEVDGSETFSFLYFVPTSLYERVLVGDQPMALVKPPPAINLNKHGQL